MQRYGHILSYKMYIAAMSMFSMDERKTRYGKCPVCKAQYIKETWDNRENAWCGYSDHECPSCKYPFYLAFTMAGVINLNASVNIGSTGKIRVNSNELASLLEKQIRGVWPKK